MEAGHFTPWLAEHLGALGEALGMELELRGHEAQVGPFSLDLLAHGLGRDRTVIIENQIAVTDHDHLGKLLTYAAGFDAGAIVWIAAEFREQHRQAVDWLNQRTDQQTEFFGVVIEAWRIDDSRPAYNFKLVAAPNEWRKSAVSGGSAQPSERGEAYRVFFQLLIDRLRDKHFTRARKAQAQNWYAFTSGVSGLSYGVSFALGGRLRVDAYIDRGDGAANKELFDRLAATRLQIEEQFGAPLKWERLDDKRASRIALYRDGTIDDAAQLDELGEWAIDSLLRLKRVFNPSVAALLVAEKTGDSGSTVELFTVQGR